MELVIVGPSSNVVLTVMRLESPICAVSGTIVAIEMVLDPPAGMDMNISSDCTLEPSVI